MLTVLNFDSCGLDLPFLQECRNVAPRTLSLSFLLLLKDPEPLNGEPVGVNVIGMYC